MQAMKSTVVYYSLDGNTRFVAQSPNGSLEPTC